MVYVQMTRIEDLTHVNSQVTPAREEAWRDPDSRKASGLHCILLCNAVMSTFNPDWNLCCAEVEGGAIPTQEGVPGGVDSFTWWERVATNSVCEAQAGVLVTTSSVIETALTGTCGKKGMRNNDFFEMQERCLGADMHRLWDGIDSCEGRQGWVTPKDAEMLNARVFKNCTLILCVDWYASWLICVLPNESIRHRFWSTILLSIRGRGEFFCNIPPQNASERCFKGDADIFLTCHFQRHSSGAKCAHLDRICKAWPFAGI